MTQRPPGFDILNPTWAHFYVEAERGAKVVTISENRGAPSFSELDRCVLPAEIWVAIRKPVEAELRRQLKAETKAGDRAAALEGARFVAGRTRLSLRFGREILVLAWAVEAGGDVDAAIERWTRHARSVGELAWMYRQVVEQGYGRADSANVGWRRALKVALGAWKADPVHSRQGDLFENA